MLAALGACLVYILGSIWPPFGVQSDRGSKSDFKVRPFLDLLLTSLGKLLDIFVGPKLTPRWRLGAS